jgi:hypothetical protein
VHIEAGDAGDVLVAAMAKTARFQCSIPATLLFIEARQEHIHLAMQRLVGMRSGQSHQQVSFHLLYSVWLNVFVQYDFPQRDLTDGHR